MAGTWEVTITPIDVSTKTASISATRTDGLDIKTYGNIIAILNTDAQKLAVLDQIWDMYQADLMRDTAINIYIGTMVADAKTNLEARE